MITGGAGFMYGTPSPLLLLFTFPELNLTKGRASWLVRHLVLTYPSYNIISFDTLDYCASLDNTSCVSHHPNFTFVRGSITDSAAVAAALSKYSVDTIIHFAAHSHVDLSFGNPLQFTATNVLGTHILLECARKHGEKLKRFIHVSTDEVYGEMDESEGDAQEEGTLLRPTNPYAASKAAAEMFVHAYLKSYKMPIIIVRGNNVYGPHQYPESKFTPCSADIHN